MNGLLLEFAGRMADSGARQLPENFQQLAVNAQFFVKTRMAGSDLGKALGLVKNYRLNLKKGRITLEFETRPDISADAQIAGTYSDDGTFMWGWSHPEVPEPMQAAAWAVQQFGDRQEIEQLLTRGGQTDAGLLDKYLAICAYISNADGVFLGDHGGGGKVCVCIYQGDQLKALAQ